MTLELSSDNMKWNNSRKCYWCLTRAEISRSQWDLFLCFTLCLSQFTDIIIQHSIATTWRHRLITKTVWKNGEWYTHEGNITSPSQFNRARSGGAGFIQYHLKSVVYQCRYHLGCLTLAIMEEWLLMEPERVFSDTGKFLWETTKSTCK